MNSGILAEILDKMHINLVRYGHGKHPEGTLITTSFPDFDVWYMLSGSLMLDINGKKYKTKPSDAFLMTPGTTITLSTLEYTELIFCHFTAEYDDNTSIQGNFSDYRIPAVHEDLLKVFARYFFSFYTDCITSKISVKSILKILLSEMLLSNTDDLNAFLHKSAYTNLKQLSPAIIYIHENMSANITNKKLSSLVGFNESYFSRYFKKQIGLSPKQYILKIKMNFARHLLVEDGLSVKETAYKVGFSDQFIFSKKFKRIYGISPSALKDINI